MRLNWAMILVGLVLLVCCSWSPGAALVNTSSEQEKSLEGGNKPRLFRILDFDKFKLVFGKKYKSWVEELSRMRIFLANCFESFVSTLNYTHGRASSYKSINQMSDWALEEWRATLKRPAVNRRHVHRKEEEKEAPETPQEVDEESLKRDAELQAGEIHDELDVQKKMIEAARLLGKREADKSLLEILNVQQHQRQAGKTRRKRDLAMETVDSRPEVEVADLMGGVLSQLDRLEHLNETELASTESRVAETENELELLAGGNLPSEEAMHNKKSNLNRLASRPRVEMFVDHRNCFVEPKYQSKCGSCYAFAGIALLEYYYCRLSGRQNRFSEQFVVDCGEDACDGGYAWEVLEFSSKYGLEREEVYPYFSQRRKCLFGKPIMDPSKSGYWHIHGLRWRRVELAHFERELANGPILVDLAVSVDFAKYGGGVDELECKQGEDLHAMVLVGHGRENGRNFWLIRNSYSTSWGENGYYRISKRSFRKCYANDPESGYVIEGSPRFKPNRFYDFRITDKLLG